MGYLGRANKKYKHGFALVRLDLPLDGDHPENRVSVLRVFTNEKTARAEQKRVSTLNANKNCLYFVQVTRMVPDD
jgi:hypothetical protein